MRTIITLLAYLHILKERICNYMNGLRRDWLLPFAKAGGYDMLLLNSGSWIAYNPSIPQSHIRARYYSEKHVVVSLDSSKRLSRNSWLSVVSEGQDMSEFFSSVRFSEGLYISNEERLMLFAHQKGWFPVAPLSIIMRDGSLEQLYVFPKTSKSMINCSDVNYIR